MLEQSLSVVGAFLILAAYAANQRGWLSPRNAAYNLMNLVGSLCLLWVAVVDVRWGFIALEAVWALLSIPPLFRRPQAKAA